VQNPQREDCALPAQGHRRRKETVGDTTTVEDYSVLAKLRDEED
jgi:hypothetical protein